VRLALGNGVVSLAAAVAAGSLVYAAGLWRFRRILRLPGLSRRSPAAGAI
jgi:hypothetical protein